MLLLPVPNEAQQTRLQDSARMVAAGDLFGAEKEARLALADAPSRAVAYAILGAIRLQQAKYLESVDFLETAARLNPRLIGVQLNLGNVYVLQGKANLATARFHQVLKLDPKNFEARFALARLEYENGRYATSIELAKPVMEKLRTSDDGLILLASDYLSLHDRTVLPSLMADWFALKHPTPATSLSFAEILADHELLEQAITILDHTRNEEGGSFDLNFNLGVYYSKLNDLQRAAVSYKLALATRPDCSSCLYQLSRISERQQNLDEALSELVDARQIAPNDADILFEFGRICVRKDLYNDAIASLSAAVRLRPNDPSFQYVLASAYTGKKEYKLAIPILQQLLSLKPNDPLLNYSLGAVEYLDADLNDAEMHLERSIQIDPNQVASYYYLGLTKNHQGKSEEAAQILQTVAERFPDHAPTFVALGKILVNQHKYIEARSALEKATQLDSQSVESHYQLGLVLARLGQSEASKKEFALVKTLNTERDAQTEMEIFSPSN